MGTPVAPLPPSLPDWLFKAAANDNTLLTARQEARRRWVGAAAEKAVARVSESAGASVLEAGVAIATPVAFLGVMGLAAYAYLSDRAHYQNKLFTPCGTEPKRRNPLPSGSPTKLPAEWMPQHTKSLPRPLSPLERERVRAYVARPEFSESAALGIDTKGKSVKVVLQDMQKSLELAEQIAHKQTEILHHQKNGQAHLARRAQQELNQLMAHAQATAQRELPAGSMGLQIKASAAANNSSDAGKSGTAAEILGKNVALLMRLDVGDMRGRIVRVLYDGSLSFVVRGEGFYGETMWRLVRESRGVRAVETKRNSRGNFWTVPFQTPPVAITSAIASLAQQQSGVSEISGTEGKLQSSSQPVDKTWWRAVADDQKPERGERRWYIEKTRDGFRVTQLQEWNGSDWRPLKLKGEPVPMALQEKLYARNPPAKPQSGPATNTNVPSLEIIADNIEKMSTLPDGASVIAVGDSGRLNTPGSSFIISVGPDSSTGLRRWTVTPQGSVPVHLNVRRAIEKLNEDSTQVRQIADILDTRQQSVRLTFIPLSQKWVQIDGERGGRYEPRQRGYELRRTGSQRGTPQKWEFDGNLVYHAAHGKWDRSSEIGQTPTPLLAKAIEVINAKLAGEIQANERTQAEITRPAVRLTESEIAAGAAVIAQQFDQKASVFEVLYVDAAGHVLNKDPLSGVRFELRLSRKTSSNPDVTLRSVWALSGEKWLWEATMSPATRADGSGRPIWFVNDPFEGGLPDIEMPADFPLETVEKVLETVRHKLTTSHDAARIANALSTYPVQTFMLDSTGRVDGKNGMRFEVTLRWNEKQRWAETTHLTAFAENGYDVVWDATLDNGTYYTYRGRDVESRRVSLPSEFPIDAYRATLNAVSRKMPAR